MLYDNNPDNVNKRPEWSKLVVTDIDGPGRKYTINTDTGRNISRTCRDLRPDGLYVNNSGCISRPPDRLIVKM